MAAAHCLRECCLVRRCESYRRYLFRVLSVGSSIANRLRTETEPLIGYFSNVLALRDDLSGNPSFLELLDRVKQTTLEAYTHQDVPFERIVDAVEPERE